MHSHAFQSNLSRQDLLQLQRWLSSKTTLSEVLASNPTGLVENVRFSESARNAYVFLWTWSAPRFGGEAGVSQERVYQRYGYASLTRRYARANRIISNIINNRVSYKSAE